MSRIGRDVISKKPRHPFRPEPMKPFKRTFGTIKDVLGGKAAGWRGREEKLIMEAGIKLLHSKGKDNYGEWKSLEDGDHISTDKVIMIHYNPETTITDVSDHFIAQVDKGPGRPPELYHATYGWSGNVTRVWYINQLNYYDARVLINTIKELRSKLEQRRREV